MKKLSLLLLLFAAALQGFAQTTNISTGVDVSGVPYARDSKDMTWKLLSPSPVTPNPWVIDSPHYLWQATPITGTNAQWIGGFGKLEPQKPGEYIFERIFAVSAGVGNLNYNFSLVYDDVLNSIELIDPSNNTTNLMSKYVTPGKPYFLDKPITGDIKCPQGGEWKLRIKIKFIDSVGGLLLSGKVNGGGACQVETYEDRQCCIGKVKNISTGFDDASNSLTPNNNTDDDWKITTTPGGTAVAVVSNPAAYYASASSKAQWLIPAKSYQKGGMYRYERTITIAPGMEGAVTFSRIGADNDVELLIETGGIGTSLYKSNQGGYAFMSTRAIVKPACLTTAYLKPGTHKIVCMVDNQGDGRTGLLVEGCLKERKLQVKTIKINKGIDAMNHQLNPTMNRSTYVSNAITNWTYQGTPAVTSSVIQFDPASYPPAGSTIVSARIYLYENIAPSNGTLSGTGHTAYTAQTNPNGFVIDAINTPWNISTVSWATKPSIAPLTGFLAGYLNTVPACTGCVGLGTDNISWDVKKIVEYQMSMGNYGFNLKFADENPANYYRSRWFGSFESSKAPVLEITYY